MAEGEDASGEAQKDSSPALKGLIDLAARAASKITSQPLLFVIAIAALLVVALALGRLAPRDLRFLITTIALLAGVALLVFLLVRRNRESAPSWERERREVVDPPDPPPAPSSTYTVNAPGSIGVAAGPGARVEQRNFDVGKLPSVGGDVSLPVKDELLMHVANLQRLRAKAALYSRNEAPRELAEEIAGEERVIEVLRSSHDRPEAPSGS